jgi:predicted HicB family RNase H-like nuclease
MSTLANKNSGYTILGMAKAGRPPRDPKSGASKHFIMRLTDAERESYALAAERAGMSLSEWIRERLSRAAKRENAR